MRDGHKRMAHNSDKKYECEVCHKRFNSIPHKKVHEKVHEEPKFECSFCKKRVKTKEALGPYSIEKIVLEFWLEKQHEIPYIILIHV